MKCNAKLAIHGGSPLRLEPLPARRQFDDSVVAAINEVVEYYRNQNRDWGYQDFFEKRYTDLFSQMMGGGYADAVCTGTVAVYVALLALHLEKQSEVIVSPITDPGTVNAIIQAGLTPVLADAMPNSYNTGPNEIRRAISARTSAFLVVHAAGEAAPIEEICDLATEFKVKVVEDCSQAHMARYNGKPVGSFGDIAAFSTMYRKSHASGGCGGIVFTRDFSLYSSARSWADRGKPFLSENFREKEASTFLFPALNFNQDEISCAIGEITLKTIESVKSRRLAFVKVLGSLVDKQSNCCRGYSFSNESSPFFLPIWYDGSELSCTKQEFAEALKGEGFDINPRYDYVLQDWNYLQPYLSGEKSTPFASQTRDSSFNILFNEFYSSREAEDIVAAMQKVTNYYSRKNLM